MISLEQEVTSVLAGIDATFVSNADSTTQLDFVVYVPGNGTTRKYYLEVKEKRQKTNTSAWPKFWGDPNDIFILDELTFRRMVVKAPNAGVLVRDNTTGNYYFADIRKLVLMPKIRVNRIVSDTCTKGKLMFDLSNFQRLGLKVLYDVIRTYVHDFYDVYVESTPCLGKFNGESIPFGGERRTKGMREYDYNATR